MPASLPSFAELSWILFINRSCCAMNSGERLCRKASSACFDAVVGIAELLLEILLVGSDEEVVEVMVLFQMLVAVFALRCCCSWLLWSFVRFKFMNVMFCFDAIILCRSICTYIVEF